LPNGVRTVDTITERVIVIERSEAVP
jgi:hypothetical protein